MRSSTIHPRLTAFAAMAGGAMAAAAGVLQATGLDWEGTAVTTAPQHVCMALFAASLVLTIPTVLALAEQAVGRLRIGRFGIVAGQLAVATAATVSNIRGEDASWFPAVAGPANLVWALGSIALAVALYRTARVPARGRPRASRRLPRDDSAEHGRRRDPRRRLLARGRLPARARRPRAPCARARGRLTIQPRHTRATRATSVRGSPPPMPACAFHARQERSVGSRRSADSDPIRPPSSPSPHARGGGRLREVDFRRRPRSSARRRRRAVLTPRCCGVAHAG